MAGFDPVVGWEGSTEARQALEWAAERLEHAPGGVRIVRVLGHDGSGDPADRVDAARESLRGAILELTDRWPRIAVAAELLVGDPVTELARVAGHDRLLVLGASRLDGVRRADARRVPIALAARPFGMTAVVPAGARRGRAGVVAVVAGTEHSRGAIGFAARFALDHRERLALVRLHDPYAGDDHRPPIDLHDEAERLRDRAPGLDVRVDGAWVSTPDSLVARSDAAALLVLEGARSVVAPPRHCLERRLAAQARAPFAIVAEPGPVTGHGRVTSPHHQLLLAV